MKESSLRALFRFVPAFRGNGLPWENGTLNGISSQQEAPAAARRIELMLKRPHYIALGVVAILTLILLKLPDRTITQFKLVINGLFLPLFGLSGSVNHLTDEATLAVIPRKQLTAELQQLRRENQELRLRLVQLEQAEQENARFRQYLKWPKPAAWKLKLARVIARDPANWWWRLKIDLGLRDGVTTNCPVLSGEGQLVGRISEAGFTQSQVVLLGDPDCRVGVLVKDTRDNGVIAPTTSSPLDNSLVDVVYLSRSSPLQSGQEVVTSGAGGVFPPDIPIGQIVDWRTVGYGLYNEARVRLAADMNRLEEIWVKLP